MNTVEVHAKEKSARDHEIEKALKDIGMNADVHVSDVYYIEGEIDQQVLELLCEPLTETTERENTGQWIIEVRYKDAVSDPAENSIVKALSELGKTIPGVRTAKRYYLRGELTEKEIKSICRNIVANSIVEDYYYGFELLEVSPPQYRRGDAVNEIAEISILDADERKLSRISKEGVLSLSVDEMKAIQDYFKKEGRNPSDAELESIAQTWSEHCKHKTFNSRIDFNGEMIDNLFKETIAEATNKIAPTKEWLVSVFKDNAGIIKVDDKNNFAFKVETHNHPSALEPYGGSSTGIGGVIRDVIGAGLGAKPIFSTDVFCFASPTFDKEIPSGILHPLRIMKGVVQGVQDYGNRMGIPTVNGAIVFHDDYLGAPLVYCGTGGVIPKGMEHKEPQPDDLIVVAGAPTGRDGLHGATFSSIILDESSSRSAVQIGNPLEEKKLLDALMEARDKKLYTCITDCGGGGFSSAIGEMGAECGVEVNLETVPLKHAGMKPWEIWLSESQERMIIAVPEKNLEALQRICEKEDVTATVIGRFTDTKRLKAKYNGTDVLDLDMDFLHNSPKQTRIATWQEYKGSEPQLEEKDDYTEELKKLLAHPTIASKETVIRRYDHEVQGKTIVKPLTGAFNDGPSDAAVVKTGIKSAKAIVVANGINPRYGLIDSYAMATSVIDEALRNITASGGNIDRTAILDNFCWGNTDEPEKLGSLVRAARGCHDAAVIFETPFISGKDSLHNEFKSGEKTIAIPDTLLISAVSVIDAENAMTSDLKEAGNSVYLVGNTYDELGGSYYYELYGEIGKNVPVVHAEGKQNMEQVRDAILKGLVRSCHDLSEGGLAVAAAEMAIAGNTGLKLDIRAITTVDKTYKKLFSESNSRFLAEVRKEDETAFEQSVTNCTKIGETTGAGFVITSGKVVVDTPVEALKKAWKGTLQW